MRPSPPPLRFGEHGELTIETINQVELTPDERVRAMEMLEAQHAYLQIIDAISYPVDPDGNVYDLAVMQPAVWAIAYTLALNGFRQSGPMYVKKRAVEGGPPGMHTWADARNEDDSPIIMPEQPVEQGWNGVKPEVTVVNEPRPDWMN